MKGKEELRLKEIKKIEEELYLKGTTSIAGIDEAGRGPLAGPVVVACVMMPRNSMIEGVNDSKKVSEKKREMLYDIIIEEAIAYGVGIIPQEEIDRINILNATKEGLTIAIKEMEKNLKEKELGFDKPDIILVDALTKIDTDHIPYKSIVKGDAKSYSIAAASIIAKVTRDRIMRQWDEVYPMYGFSKHKGYGTVAHIAAIKEYGLCPLHRRSFVKNIVGWLVNRYNLVPEETVHIDDKIKNVEVAQNLNMIGIKCDLEDNLEKLLREKGISIEYTRDNS